MASRVITAFSRLVVNSLFSKEPDWLFKLGKELFAVKRGGKVIVKSRTRRGIYHVVDLEKGTCTCEAAQNGLRCWHIEAAKYAEAAD